MEKSYRVCIAFGDGRPINTQIKAKSGAAACDLIKKQHPCAKAIHVLGLVDSSVEEEIPIQRPDPVVKERTEHPPFN